MKGYDIHYITLNLKNPSIKIMIFKNFHVFIVCFYCLILIAQRVS
jgi:hypothetical protein